MRVANAPCSWGTLEFERLEGEQIGYAQMLNELAEAGYFGTELGDWGYMPTHPPTLAHELDSRGLSMRGAFVPVSFSREEAVPEGLERALKTARLIAAVKDTADPPLLVLADNNGSDAARTKCAGRIDPSLQTDIGAFARRVEFIARTVRQETGIEVVFHHHCAGFVETPEETAEFLASTDSETVNLVFDTGHWAYASSRFGDVSDAIDRHGDRIRHVHFKDCDPQIAESARLNEWDYFEAVRKGVFCELGKGGVDFPCVLERLRHIGYDGWIVVEQDVLPGMGAPKKSAARSRAYLRSLGI